MYDKYEGLRPMFLYYDPRTHNPCGRDHLPCSLGVHSFLNFAFDYLVGTTTSGALPFGLGIDKNGISPGTVRFPQAFLRSNSGGIFPTHNRVENNSHLHYLSGPAVVACTLRIALQFNREHSNSSQDKDWVYADIFDRKKTRVHQNFIEY